MCSIDPHEASVEFKYLGRECPLSGALPAMTWAFSYADVPHVLDVLLTFVSESCLLAVEWMDRNASSSEDEDG